MLDLDDLQQEADKKYRDAESYYNRCSFYIAAYIAATIADVVLVITYGHEYLRNRSPFFLIACSLIGISSHLWVAKYYFNRFMDASRNLRLNIERRIIELTET